MAVVIEEITATVQAPEPGGAKDSSGSAAHSDATLDPARVCEVLHRLRERECRVKAD